MVRARLHFGAAPGVLLLLHVKLGTRITRARVIEPLTISHFEHSLDVATQSAKTRHFIAASACCLCCSNCSPISANCWLFAALTS